MSEIEEVGEIELEAEAAAAIPPGGRRRRVARGTVINSAFLVGLGTLNLLKAFIVAAFLTASEFGVWSILFLALAFVGAIKAVAVSDKYVQQEEPDQERAFQKAFTLELGTSGAMTLVMLALAPLLALAYGQDKLLLPGLALALVLPPLAFQQASIAVFYRRMDFLRQRLLMSVDPVVSFAVTVPLAIAGLGYWSLVVGALAGTFTGAVVALAACPYRLALRWEGETTREYLSFSWPLVVAIGAALLMAQLSVFFGELTLGLAGAGAIGLASAWSSYADRIDQVISAALYPAVCRVRDRGDLLLEAFTKSNRLALMWGFPFGVGLTLFAADLVDFGIGEQWEDALILFQVFGLMAAAGHIGFNWTAFYRAIGDTRPIAIVTGVGFASFLALAVPMLLLFELEGFAAGMAASVAIALVARWVYLARLFPSFEIVRYTLRAIAPTAPAAGCVLLTRIAVDAERTLGMALGELALYLAVTAIATVVLERPLLREALSYLRRAPEPEGRLQAA
jgi:O-antigen/teichoic acid export membrane protein